MLRGSRAQRSHMGRGRGPRGEEGKGGIGGRGGSKVKARTQGSEDKGTGLAQGAGVTSDS